MTMISEKSRKTNARPWLYALVALVILFVWYFVLGFFKNEQWVKAVALSCIYLGYIVWWVRRTRSVKSLFFYFLCYTALTNAGQLFLYVLNIEIVGIVDVFLWASEDMICKAMDYQMLCTVFMCTCAMIAHEQHSMKEENSIQQTGLLTLPNETVLSWPECIFIVSGLLYSVMSLLRLGSRMDSAYLDAFNSGESQGAPFLVTMTFYVSLYMVCYIHRHKGDKFQRVILIIGVLAGISTLLFGSRNVLIPLVFGMVFLWGDRIKSVSWIKKILVVVAALAFLYLIGAFVNVRRMSLSSLSFTALIDALFGERIYDQLVILISEMGGSLRVLTTTISAVDTEVVQSEQTFLYTFLKGIVPKVSILNLLGIDEPIRWRLSEWITDKYGANAGWGYSMYAETYYNFKNFGFLFMGTFGYFYSWLECKIAKWYSKGYTVMASAWLFFATYVIFLARAESLLITTRIRYVLYLSILCMILRNRVSAPRLNIKLEK